MSKSINKTGIHPKGYRVLIKPLEVTKTTKSGIILATEELSKREQMANTTGEVLAVGSDCNGWCKPGDRVVHAKFAGLLYLGKDGNEYRVINDEDVVAILDKDVELVDPHLAKHI